MEPNPTSLAEETLDQIIAAYEEAVDAGQTPDRQEWMRRHPEAASALASFFADQDHFDQRIAPLRQCAGGGWQSNVLPAPGARIGAYELMEEIARGGMGIVFKARQVHLQRTVALKMILSGALASPAEQQRFRLEAEAAANLDHPHIVPIYEIDTWQNQLYFSMRLIEGGSLAQALASGRWQATEPGAATRAARLVATIARAVHFAHERGILHRDLKPGNVLLAQGDSPHVTDFGLALWLQREPVQGAATPRSRSMSPSPPYSGERGRGEGAEVSASLPPHPRLLSPEYGAEGSKEGGPACGGGGRKEGDRECRGAETPPEAALRSTRLTETGIAVGTPSYMAPEQAALAASAGGNRGLAPTTAADVYSLGAILYELLTGRPPFRGATPLETLRSVLEESPLPPRQVNASVPRDLESICLKCLAREASRRYPSAAALADDLDRYVRGEPIEARPVGRMGRFSRWCRRQPALAAACLLAALGLVGVAVVALLFALSESRGRARLDEALTQTRLHQKLAEENFQKAHKAIDDFYIRFSQEGLGQMPGSQALQKELMTTGLKYYQEFLKQKADDPKLQADLAHTNLRVGDITSHLGSKQEALPFYERALALYGELSDKEPAHPSYKKWSAGTHLNRGVVLAALGKQAEALAAYEKARDLWLDIHKADPQNAESQHNLGMALSNIGSGRRALGQLDKALTSLEEAQSLQQALVARHGGVAAYEHELARTYIILGVVRSNLDQGEASYQAFDQARVLQEKLAARFPQQRRFQQVLAVNYRRLAVPLCNRGHTKQGLGYLDRSKTMLTQLVDANPEVAEYLVDWATTLRTLGDIRRGQNDLATAQDCYQQIRDRLERLNAVHEGVASFQAELAHACFALSVVHLGRNDSKNALACLERSRQLQQHLVDQNPDNRDYRHDLGFSLVWRGRALVQAGKLREGLASVRAGISLESQNVVAAPMIPKHQRTLLDHCKALVKLHKDAVGQDEALEVWREARDQLATLARRHDGVLDLSMQLARVLVDHGSDLRTAKRPGEALEKLKQAQQDLAALATSNRAKTLAELAHVHFQLGLTYSSLEDVVAEIREFQEAVTVQGEHVKLGDHPQAQSSLGIYYHNLGQAHGRGQKPAAAEDALRQAVFHQRRALDAGPQQAAVRATLHAHYGALGDLLRAAGKPREAAVAAEERLKLGTKEPKQLFLIARDLGLSANLIGKAEDKLTPAERAERERIDDLCLQALRQALAAGYKDRAELNRHPAFAAVRDRPEFQQLMIDNK